MSEIKDGGAAFAAIATSPIGDVHHQEGMSLRDWFAGQALVGILSNESLSGQTYEADAWNAYRAADAMLAERAKAVQP